MLLRQFKYSFLLGSTFRSQRLPFTRFGFKERKKTDIFVETAFVLTPNFTRNYRIICLHNNSLQEGMCFQKAWRDASVPTATLRNRSQSAKNTNEDSENLEEKSPSALISSVYISTLSEILDCTTEDVKILIERHPFLAKVNLDILAAKVKLLRSHDIPVDLLRDHMRFIHERSEAALTSRLHILQKNGILHSSVLPMDKLPHVLECNAKVFERVFSKLMRHKEALEDCADQLKYLQYRLKCSEQQALSMLDSYPLERHMSNDRLKQLLDFFLMEAKLNPEFVLRNRKLLHFSPSRLRERWEIFRAAGVTNEFMMIQYWFLPEEEFEAEFSHTFPQHLKPFGFHVDNS